MKKIIILVLVILLVALAATAVVLLNRGGDDEVVEAPAAATPTPVATPTSIPSPEPEPESEPEEPADPDGVLEYDEESDAYVADGYDGILLATSTLTGAGNSPNGLLPGGWMANDQEVGVTLNWVDALRIFEIRPEYAENLDHFSRESGISSELVAEWAEALKVAGLDRMATVAFFVMGNVTGVETETAIDEILEVRTELKPFRENIPVIRVDSVKYRVWNTWYKPGVGPQKFIDNRAQVRLGLVPLIVEKDAILMDLETKAFIAVDCRNVFWWEARPVVTPTPTTPEPSPSPSPSPSPDPSPSPAPVTEYDTVTVHFREEVSNAVLRPSYTETHPRGTWINVTSETNWYISGYTRTRVTGDSATGHLNGNRTITVWYQRDYVPPQTVTVTVRFINEDADNIRVRSDASRTVNLWDWYNVSDLIPSEIGRFRFIRTTGGATSGTASSNVTITAWYREIVVDMPTPEVRTPTVDSTREPGNIVIDERGGQSGHAGNLEDPPTPDQDLVIHDFTPEHAPHTSIGEDPTSTVVTRPGGN